MRARLQLLAIVAGGLLLAGGCSKQETPTPRLRFVAQPGPAPTILLSQAQFAKTTDEETGTTKPQTLPARLVILRQQGDEWKPEVLEDPESNVFHKAIVCPDDLNTGTSPGILTIGANAAALKLWHQGERGWIADTWWNPTFGGKQNRLRDFEIGDVTGDGNRDIAVVTHDQGVVAVLTHSDAGWQATEIDRKPNTFVHECELGDLDGDGLLEIYATPSQPNKFDGTPQPGEIVAYYHTPDGFKRRTVEEFPLRHVKEILATDIDGDGRTDLLASVEAEQGERPDAPPDASLVLVKRYHFDTDHYVGEVVCTLPDRMCRFFNAGDVDGDGKPELIASTHKKGIWLARPGPTPWKTELIDADSSGGIEHATTLADLDNDGVQEIYVAADDQRQVRRYRWVDGHWDRQVLSPIEKSEMTFNIYAGKF